MTWVPVQESGLYFSFDTQDDSTFDSSIGAIINGVPPFDGTFVVVSFDASVHHLNLELGWSGRVRMTVQSFNAVSPGVGQPFEASEISQRASGDALIDGVTNDQAPFPAVVWGADDVVAFTPAEFIGDCPPQWTYDPETNLWSGTPQTFQLRTATMTTVSFAVLFEVEMDAVPPPGSFWTNLINVRQES